VGSPFLRKDRGLSNLTLEKLPISTDTTVSPLCQHMIEDMAGRGLVTCDHGAVAHGLVDCLRALCKRLCGACEHVGDGAFGNLQPNRPSSISAKRA
jgi:hypothetical protein